MPQTQERCTLYSPKEYGKFVSRVRELGFKLDCAYPRFERFVREKPFGWIQIFTICANEEWFICAESDAELNGLFVNI